MDGKTVYMLGKKMSSLAAQRKNPRKLAWTVGCRRKNKKGDGASTTRKRARKVVKYQRAVGDMSVADLMKKKAESKDTRNLAREQAIRAAKDKAKKEAAARKKVASKSKGPKGGNNVPKNQKR
jgi:large subunit ribosomal protein L24e